MRIVRLAVVLGLFALLGLLGQATPPPSSASGLIIVETTDDEVQFDGTCSIRHALGNANANAQPFTDCEPGTAGLDVIMLPAGTIVFDAFAGALIPTDDVTFLGDNGGTSTLDGGDATRILEVPEDIDVTVDTLTLKNGYSSGFAGGGAINNAGNLVIRNSILEENLADGGHGGAIKTSGANLHLEDSILQRNRAGISGGAIVSGGGPCGTLSLLRVVIVGNSAWTYGGGINSCADLTIDDSAILFNDVEWAGGGIENTGDAVIRDSLIGGNEVDGDMEQNGGGIRNAPSGNLTVERSLLADNMADHGGGISNAGEATITNTTFTNNFGPSGSNFSSGDDVAGGPAHASLLNVTISAASSGTVPQGGLVATDSGIGGPLGTVQLTNTIIAADDDANCTGGVTIVSLGHNISSDDTCNLNATGDQQDTNPLLAPLADNGGPTRTHALLAGSPALGAADQAACPDDDQRGEPRPQGDGCDVGAFESALTAPTPTPSPTPTASPTPTSTVEPTPTEKPTATGEPTPSPTGQEVIWGDNNCSDEADPVDALIGLRHDAGLPAETNDCPEMGEETPVLGFDTYPWGDVDCSDAVDPVDSLKILRFDAGLSVEQEELCPMLGDLVVIPDA